MPPSKTGFRSLKCLVTYTITRSFQLIFLLSLCTHSLFSTQPSKWDLENVNQISFHPCIKLSNASHHLGENSKSSEGSTRPSWFCPFFSLLPYHHLSFLLCCSYTGLPVCAKFTSFTGLLHILFFCFPNHLLPQM